MSRTERLLELMIAVRARGRFTVEEMAQTFGVSRRTMLRDLQALSEMGVPLAARPGPYGGYSLVPGARMLPLTLILDEAIGVLISYESFGRYAETPFRAQSRSALTKLRNAFPADLTKDLDATYACVAIVEPRRAYEAPLLAELLTASVNGVHLRIDYESRSRSSQRLIYPLGVYASEGFWYVACYDYLRRMLLSLRADRVLRLAHVPDLEPPTMETLRGYLATINTGAPDFVPLSLAITPRAARSYDFESVFGTIPLEGGDALFETEIPLSEIDFYASRLLPLGDEVVVRSPPQLIEAMRLRALAILALYG